ncbi:L-alanine-DL-glutamate epimerase-like enolase superfamily enzyme [Rubrivivax gelatinosus]|uniref:enolase C-terminal domain-like protein n=1 Tax=Rubrivivax gelatinosus TaxID=28068 RepID=UPI0018C9E016|nr:enolase C-terminal domain-like protein [Rubrivivax gelatinosus]MBG6080637.1 L-alanine-DL-glutamate epimerase-like enolase superfamily enzyme [Rubrivivax gelatinosus]
MNAASLRLRLGAPERVDCGAVVVRGTARPRIALRIALAAGAVRGRGEALPLPGFSHDDADGVEDTLTTLAGVELHLPGEGSPAARLDAALAPHAARLERTPSARFALECALLDAAAQAESRSAAEWLADGRTLQPVAVSVLLPDDERAPAVAAAAAARGHRVLKLKIAIPGRSDADEGALLAAVQAAAPGVRLRLDANGALVPGEAPARLAALARHGVELVEEPCLGVPPPLPLPWAADESLADPARAAALLALPADRRPAAWVLKPALLGLARCLTLADAAAAAGIGLIVTHAFDGDTGFAAACALAQALPLAPRPCGLEPHAGLERDWPAAAWLPPAAGPGLLPPV